MLTITPKINGQQADNSVSYAYLYEKLPILISTDELFPGLLKADLVEVNVATGEVIHSTNQVDYIVLEYNLNNQAEIDVMEVIRQYCQNEWFKIGKLSDITWETIITKSIYRIAFDYGLPTQKIIYKLPIIGGRNFHEFVPYISSTNKLDEWGIAGQVMPSFIGYPLWNISLQSGILGNYTPSVSYSIPTSGRSVCGAALVYKSKFGGWCTYGFNIFSETNSSQYLGDISFDNFRAVNSHAYLSANYTGIVANSQINLKTVGISKIDADALRGITQSPAIYLMRTPSSPLELVRLNSFSAPVNNLSGGTTVDINLTTIHQLRQDVR